MPIDFNGHLNGRRFSVDQLRDNAKKLAELAKNTKEIQELSITFLGRQPGVLTTHCDNDKMQALLRSRCGNSNEIEVTLQKALRGCKPGSEQYNQIRALHKSIRTIIDTAGPENRIQVLKTLSTEILPTFLKGDSQTRAAILLNLNNPDALESLDQARQVDQKYQSVINDINKRISATNTGIKTLKSAIESNDDTIRTNDTIILKNNKKIEELEKKRSNRDRGDIEAQIKRLSADNAQRAKHNADLRQRNNDMASQITTLNADLVTYREQLANAPKPTCVNNWVGFASSTVQQTASQPTQRDVINGLYTSLSKTVVELDSSEAISEALLTLNNCDNTIYSHIPSSGLRQKDFINNINRLAKKHLSDTSLVSPSDKERIFTEIPIQYEELALALNEGVGGRIRTVKADDKSSAYAELFWNRPGAIPTAYIDAVNKVAKTVNRMYVGEFDLNVRADGTIGNDIRAWSTTEQNGQYFRYDLLFRPSTQKITDISDENPMPLYPEPNPDIPGSGSQQHKDWVATLNEHGVLT